jgi:hypothetical protein
MAAASQLWSVIRIRTRAGKARLTVLPARHQARHPVLASENGKGPRESGHVAYGEGGILIRPVRTRGVIGGSPKW